MQVASVSLVQVWLSMMSLYADFDKILEQNLQNLLLFARGDFHVFKTGTTRLDYWGRWGARLQQDSDTSSRDSDGGANWSLRYSQQ
jgi:hypothetical protein